MIHQMTQVVISQKWVNQIPPKNDCPELDIFIPLCKFLAQNSKYPLLQKFANFLISGHPQWYGQKSQIG